MIDRETNRLSKLRDARRSLVVLKAELIQIRARLPHVLIFVFEGSDDKIVYAQWFKRLSSHIDYEPFICRGKQTLLNFRDLLKRDLNDLAARIFFFIDRDFDDLAGKSPGVDIFMTDRYSVENYLVDTTQLEQLLKNEFHCHAAPEIRTNICKVFENCYDSFLKTTQELNRRLFIGKRRRTNIEGTLPEHISQLAQLSITEASRATPPAEDRIRFEEDSTTSTYNDLNTAFAALLPTERYRGKFAITFFRAWLRLLILEYNDVGSIHFRGIDTREKPREHELVLSNFAARSVVPQGLSDFLSQLDTKPAPSSL